jgi:FkbH-like protein
VVESSSNAARQRWRDHVQAAGATGGRRLVVGVAASFTAQPVEPFLGAELLNTVDHPVIRFAGHNQIHQACLAPADVFGDLPDRLVLLWRLEDVFEADLLAGIVGDADAAQRVIDGVQQLVALVAQCAERTRLPIVVSVPPTPHGFGIDPLDVTSSIAIGTIHARACEIVVEQLSAIESVRLIDHRRLVEYVGLDAAHDARGTLLYRQPYRSAFCQLLGEEVARVLVSFEQAPPKVIVLDADDTLWGGLVGEDGVSGIAIGSDFPGNAYQSFQLALRRLAERGVLLAVCSKNDADDVMAVFRERSEMVLRLDDIAAWRVNWDAKSINVASIADELNVGLDSLVFVDDSDYELAEVGTALPEVRCVRVPDEVAELPDLLAGTGWFRSMRTSEEDTRRTRMVHQERARDASRGAMSQEEFLESLRLRVTFIAAGPQHVGRVTQLVNKTNQFNLTTRRRAESEVAALIESADHRVFVLDVEDRFGGYGLVGVAIAAGVGTDEWELDTLLMSCRVLRRGVETAFLAGIARDARASGARRLLGRYEPTAKNAQVAELYPQHGFVAQDDGTFVLDVNTGVARPGHIELSFDA